MHDYIEKFNNLQDILDMLYTSGMVDPEKNRILHQYWSLAKKNDYFQPLLHYLKLYPSILKAAIKRSRSNPFMPMPTSDEMHMISGEIDLGLVNYNKDIAGFDPMDFTRTLSIFGEIGSGKSYPVLRMLEQILSTPIDERGYNVLIIQVVKRDADYLVETNPNLRIIEWSHLKKNIFEIEPWDDPDVKLNMSGSIFAATNYFMSKTQPILNECIDICRKEKLQINFEDLYQTLGIAVSKMGYKGYEAKNLSDTIKGRLHEFIKRPQLNVRHGFRIDDFFSKEDICLNLMDEPNDYVYSMLVTDILISLQRYYETTPVEPKRMRTLVVIDECRSIFPYKVDSFDHNADRYLEKFITTRRASGIGLIALTQEPQSVSEWLTSNSAFFLSFPISGKSLKEIQAHMHLTDEQAAYFDMLPKFGVGVFKDRRFNRPYVIQIPGDIKPKSRTRSQNIELMETYVHEELYPRIEANEIETQKYEELMKSRRGNKPTPTQVNAFENVSKKYLEAIRDNYLNRSFEPIKKISEKLNLSKLEKEIIHYLSDVIKYIEVRKLHNYSKTWGQYPVLTFEGMEHIGLPKSKFIDPKHFDHTYYCERICAWLLHQGLVPHREFMLKAHDTTDNEFPNSNNNNNFSAFHANRIDVFVNDTKNVLRNNKIIKVNAIGIAIEFTNTVTEQNIIPNIIKGLTIFRNHVEHVLIACINKDDRDKAEQIVTQCGKFDSDDLSKVSFTTMSTFLEKI